MNSKRLVLGLTTPLAIGTPTTLLFRTGGTNRADGTRKSGARWRGLDRAMPRRPTGTSRPTETAAS